MAKFKKITNCFECDEAVELTSNCGEPLGEYACFNHERSRSIGNGLGIDWQCPLPDAPDGTSDKPPWWPDNPYPDAVFTMTTEEYMAVVPDELTRTRISGLVSRDAWNAASERIYEMLKEQLGG